MTLTEHKAKLLEKRFTSSQSIANLKAKLDGRDSKTGKPRSADQAIVAYVEREVAKHKAILAEIDADLKAVGVSA